MWQWVWRACWALGVAAAAGDECAHFPKVPTGPLPFTPERNRNVDKIRAAIALKQGERWEIAPSKERALFRYWNLEMELESEVSGIDLTNGWTNKSDSFSSALEFTQCDTSRHYAMLSPDFTPTLLQLALPPQELYGELDVQVFASCFGTGTALHFDRHDNFFVQLQGQKRFYLFPPELFPKLRFAPKKHPLYRQSLLTNMTWVLDEFASQVMRIDLLPGDVLFVPRLWAHYVESVTNTVGLSIRRTALEGEEETLRALALPFESFWPLDVKFAGVRHYLRALLTPSQQALLRSNWKLAFPEFRASIPVSAAVSAINPGKIAHYAHKLTFSKEMLRIEYCEEVVIFMFTPKESVEFVLNYL
ncbi:hypothetical protein BASA81_001460 [Batrachochytrium salamandrivorans]|nr:hypothetical protein BASA81_001460 [Batrachochytrium salamandrivorans]